mmetsp:Transcript_26165/g.42549  ORF Transcript_26165/g.42549 Transcript_26165/m.42549 type:complete len:82 (-) Transcript_26165:342-587(-)
MLSVCFQKDGRRSDNHSTDGDVVVISIPSISAARHIRKLRDHNHANRTATVHIHQRLCAFFQRHFPLDQFLRIKSAALYQR